MVRFKVIPKKCSISFYYTEGDSVTLGVFRGGEVYSVSERAFNSNKIFKEKVSINEFEILKEEPKAKVTREEPMVVSVTAEEVVEEDAKEVRRRGKKKQEVAE